MGRRVHTLVVFTADGCPHCRAAVEDLRRRKVRFLERNLSRDPGARAELARHCWEHRLPVIVDHERVSIGWRGNSSTFAQLGIEEG